ncbi:MAG: ATP-dependent DNA helicase RecG [Butyrivibrio sp.]|nr:ATP-dependent DNA helicase RecG [Butyrivibrio sp.]
MNRDALKQTVVSLKGIGEKTGKLFEKCGITYLEDLLAYYPRTYDAFEKAVSVCDAIPGQICAVRCAITGSMMSRHIRNLAILSFDGADMTGKIRFTYFNMPYLRNSLKAGNYYIFRGMLEKKGSSLIMEQAKIYKDEEYAPLIDTLQPRYSLIKGMTNHMFIKAMKQALTDAVYLQDPLPEEIRNEIGLIGYRDAVSQIHFPGNVSAFETARRRLSFDEFFQFVLKLRLLKISEDETVNEAVMLEVSDTARLIEALPYQLTNAQMKVWQEISEDLSGIHVMNRLIQGDVGSGKTILAFLALLMTAANGYQGAMMAPTEVLARQHYDSLKEMAKRYHLPVRPVLLIGAVSAKDKREIRDMIKSGAYNCMIGTNALIQDSVEYHNLALVITDEQHRFGVRQREKFAGKGNQTHVLAMSATPIPRTLAIILYGDLHISILNELPAGRMPVKNCVVGTQYRETAYKFIISEVEKGHQAYVICPMIEEGEMDGVENVTNYAAKMQELLPAQIQIGILHGKMKPIDKDRIMEAYATRQIDVLISTTVIEVGINVPNATVMLIENAEHFGLAQLHQLRGRVGRGVAQSYCIFINTSEKESAAKRLDIMNHSNDGFEIAEEDLKQRGPGDLFGIRQSGDLNFQIGDIYRDSDLIKAAATEADKILAKDPDLSEDENALLRDAVIMRGLKSVDFKTL